MKTYTPSSYNEALDYNKSQKFFFGEEETILYYGAASEKMWQGQNLSIDFYSHDSEEVTQAKKTKQYKRVFNNIQDLRTDDYTTLVAFGHCKKRKRHFIPWPSSKQ
jgi:hypothetical protein